MSFPGQDLFHGFHLGAAKYSWPLLWLCFLRSSLDGHMTRDLRQWRLHSFLGAPCADNKVDPYIRKLVRETINWKQTTDFPSGGWSKGSTTLSLLRWFLAACRQRSDTIPEDSLLRLCFKAAFEHQPVAALEIAKHGFQFLHYNAELAEGCFRENLALFMYMPNLHRLHHIFFDLHDEASRSDYAMSDTRACSHLFEAYFPHDTCLHCSVRAQSLWPCHKFCDFWAFFICVSSLEQALEL